MSSERHSIVLPVKSQMNQSAYVICTGMERNSGSDFCEGSRDRDASGPVGFPCFLGEVDQDP